MEREVFFLPTPGSSARGQRLCVHHGPGRTARGNVLYLHPFAEEMNKARRMAALQSRALADAGFTVLQIDLFGCGDSSGDFDDATWNDWIDDALLGCAWLQARAGTAPLTLWGLRAGALLAIDAAARLHAEGTDCALLLWQPATSGKVLLQQFLRLQMAREMLDGKARKSVDALRRDLAAGVPVEIAGYRLHPGLARGLGRAEIALCAGVRRVDWIEVANRDDAKLLPASAAVIERWASVASSPHTQVVNGPQFWQTTEVEDAPALVAATLRAMEEAQPA